MDKKKNTELNKYAKFICSNKKKFYAIDIFVFILICYYIYRFYILDDNFSKSFKQIINSQFMRYYSNKLNLTALILFFILIGLFMSIDLHAFQNLGIILFITFTTSIVEQGEAYILSAAISAIFVYIYLRLRIILYEKKNDKICLHINKTPDYTR